MRPTTTTLLALTLPLLAAAQVDPNPISALQGDLPACSVDCIVTASLASCAGNDFACQCLGATHQAITDAATPCVLRSCNGSGNDIYTTLTVTTKICKLYNDSVANGTIKTSAAAPGAAWSVAATVAAAAVLMAWVL